MDDMKKCLKETEKGITVETFVSGTSKGVKATGEKGSVNYPCSESILYNLEDLEDSEDAD